MAVLESTGGVAVQVDPTFGAMHQSLRPPEVLGWYSVGAATGLLTGVAAAGPIFSLRNLSANLLMVRRVQVGFATTTAFTTAQALSYAAMVARSFTVSDSGGAAIAVTGSQNKHRTSLATPTSLDMRIATTGAITAGTRTLDTVSLGIVTGASQAVGAALSPQSLLAHDEGDYPIILAQNEGLVITNLIAMGAAGVVNAYVNIEFAEATAF